MNLATIDRASAPSPLERCTSDPVSFLNEVWGRRVSVCTGTARRGFSDLLSLDDVDRFLTATAIRTPFFRLVKAGEQIPESTYTKQGRTGSRDVQGMADPSRVATLFEDGATLVLQGLHRWHEPVTRFCRDLELELGHPCQANAYITPSGAQGLALHEDAHDVFVLQAFGRKRWELHPAPTENTRPPIDAEVTPGDTIYMPTGTPHAASTQDVLSGHLTIGVHVTSWSEVLADVWAGLASDPSASGSVPAGWLHDPDAFAQELGRRIALQASAMRDATDPRAVTETRFQRFLSSRAQLQRGAIARQATDVPIDDDTVLRRRSGSVCEIRVQGDELRVLLGDRRLEMPGWLEPAMRRLAADDTVVLGDLAFEVPDRDSRIVLARRLIREGLLFVEDPA